MSEINPPAKRHTDQLMECIGIFHLPLSVDIEWFDGINRENGFGAQNKNPSKFIIFQRHERGHIIKNAEVHAHEMPGRTKYDIWNDLRDTLIQDFGAYPHYHRLPKGHFALPKNAREQFLTNAGIPMPLPSHLDVSMERRGDMAYLVIEDKNRQKQDILELRHTRANTLGTIVQNIREKFMSLGVPLAPANIGGGTIVTGSYPPSNRHDFSIA